MTQKLTLQHDDGTKTAFGIEELAFLFHNFPKDFDGFVNSLVHVGVIAPSEKLELCDRVFDYERSNF